MLALPTQTARKKPTNVSIDVGLLTEARSLGINLSQALESRLEGMIADERRAQWLRDNDDAVGAYNQRIISRGLFGDKARTF